jgi:hypothetical protein
MNVGGMGLSGLSEPKNYPQTGPVALSRVTGLPDLL